MISAVTRAGLAYFLIVFACAFMIGIVRVLVLAPALGEMAAVGIELPVVLLISWFAAAWVIARVGVADRTGARLGMGMLAFAILMLAEAGLAHFAFATPWPVYWAAFFTMPGLLGLSGQILFGLMPLMRLILRR